MKQGLFLDGVGVGRTEFVVIERIQCPVNIFSNKTTALFSVGDLAIPVAQKTVNQIAGRFPENGFFQMFTRFGHAVNYTTCVYRYKENVSEK
jgi:hypothetical protein